MNGGTTTGSSCGRWWRWLAGEVVADGGKGLRQIQHTVAVGVFRQKWRQRE